MPVPVGMRQEWLIVTVVGRRVNYNKLEVGITQHMTQIRLRKMDTNETITTPLPSLSISIDSQRQIVSFTLGHDLRLLALVSFDRSVQTVSFTLGHELRRLRN